MTVCPTCSTHNPPQARFCMSCGTALPAAAPATESRRTVTVVFCDVTGSTGLGERLDPESLRRVMERYFEEMRTVIERHGGSVEKFIGDAVMAVFGIPVLHEDDALRAVRAGDEMRSALAGMNEDIGRRWGVTLGARIGVNTGEVVAGDPLGGQRLVTGDAVNVAARLEQNASPGEILIGESTYRLVRDSVEVEPLEPLALKGKSLPVGAFRLLAVHPAEGHAMRLDSPMVGRDRHLSMLRQAFDAAVVDRACHLFTVLGSAGVGKSRLIREFVQTLPADAAVLTGRCLSYGDGITYWPVVEVMKAAAGVADDDDADGVRAKVDALVRSCDDAEEIAARLAELLGASVPTAAPEELFWAIRKTFESMASSRPLVVVFDDVHWGEPTFFDLIEHVADWTKDVPLLLVCVARPELLEIRPAWGGGKLNAASILLEPLPDAVCEVLIENLTGAADLPPEIRRRIVEGAEGTPLFVEEMLSMLVDDGLLQRVNSHWAPVGDLGRVEIPPSIQALLAARLDRLDREERSVVECASVEGKVFHDRAVATLAATDDALLRAHLQSLTRRELIRPERAGFAGEAFRFRHQLIRDAAYHGISKARRADLHERFAAWLEGAAGPALAEYEEILGYHLEQAYRYRAELGPVSDEHRAVAERGARHLFSAGTRAVARGDGPAAVKLLERAADLFPPGRERLRALLDLADAMLEQEGNFASANRILVRAAAEAEALDDQVLRMHVRIKRLLLEMPLEPEGFVREAQEVLDAAIPLFESVGDYRGLAMAYGLVSYRSLMLGHQPGMEEALERAVEYARLANDRPQELLRMAELAGALFWGAVPRDQALQRCQDLLEQVRGSRFVEARIERYVAGLIAMEGRIDEARRMLHRIRETFRELGASLMDDLLGFFVGPLELLAGDPAAAERELRANCDVLQRMGERSWLSSLAALLAEALYEQGRYDEAEEYVALSEESASSDDLSPQSDFRSIRAKILARRGEVEEAERLAREAVDIIERTGELDHKGDGWFDLADVLRLAGKPDEAAEALRQAVARYEAKGNELSARRARARLEQLTGAAAGAV